MSSQELTPPDSPPLTDIPTPHWPEVDGVAATAVVYLTAPNGWYATIKPTFELIATIGLSVMALPFLLVGWLAVKVSTRGRGFYTQTRSGRSGAGYSIVKLRTMFDTKENAANHNWAAGNGDARITRLGRILRALHLDELPQLWNVFRGEMSLVGPRPERPEVIAAKGLAEQVPGYHLRTLVRPGVSGLAQIQLPADSDILSVRHKVLYDLYYLSHQTLWLDFRICVGTVLKAFIGPEGLRKLLFLPTREQVCEHFLSLLAAPEGDSASETVPAT